MTRFSRILPIIGGAVAGAVIALIVASASGGTKSVTTTVVQPAKQGQSVPTSATTSHGLTVNQIYREDSPEWSTSTSPRRARALALVASAAAASRPPERAPASSMTPRATS